ncbi:hypothetical protein EV183_003833 [Coemansia sp. RSA 2336]|nr:hypothetical protein EV183_003833 [Coemansia sp. RSA 2336]
MAFFDQVLNDVEQFVKVEDAEEEICELYSVYYSNNGSERRSLVDSSKTEVEVEIKGGLRTIELTMGQNPNINSEKGQTGAVVWNSSIVLSEYLARRTLSGWDLREANIVELGAGCGLVGIALHHLGAKRVVLTDQSRLMRLLSRNIERNRMKPAGKQRKSTSRQSCPTGTLLATEYDWGRAPEDPRILETTPVDVVVVSDCVYHEAVVPLLVRTLQTVCGSRQDVPVVALVGQELRSDSVHQVFVEALLQSFVLYRVPVHPSLDKSYALYAMWLR